MLRNCTFGRGNRYFSVSPVLFRLQKNQTPNIRFYSKPSQPHRSAVAAAYDSSIPHIIPAVIQKSPIRPEFISRISSEQLEHLDICLNKHQPARDFSDWFAFGSVRALRKPSDWFFGKRYLHRAMMLETVAAVPGMVAGTLRHLKLLRHCNETDDDWIHHLIHEAENERMHLLTWLALAKPTFFDRAIIKSVQVCFTGIYTIFYFISPRTAHRFVGYLEEEAIKSYTSFLEQIDNGNIENVPAPKIAIDYWNLNPESTLRDVVLAVRADEAAHRDVNHYLAN